MSLSNEALVHACELVEPDELVLPDVLHDITATHEMAAQFLLKWADCAPNFMYVIQARSFSELQTAYDHFWLLQRRWVRVSTYGLTKDVDRYLGSRAGALACGPTTRAHLLGMRDDPYEMLFIERRFPGRVRSLDTSAPFVYAARSLDPWDLRGGDVDLEDVVFDDIDTGNVEYQIGFLDALCRGVVT